MKTQRTKQILIGLILVLSFGLINNSLMAQMNYFINSQGIPLNASATEAKQRLGNGEAYLGEIRAYPTNQNPSNWIKTDGRLLQINQYLALYGMIGNRFGGDNINTFAVPNLRGIDTNDSTNNTSWSIGGDRLRTIGLLGTLNNYDVSFVRNSAPQFTLNSGGIQSFVHYLSSGNVTLQKGNPRLRLRDTGAGGHTQGFDLHVNGNEFIIDDNTHSKNILRNYLNSNVHTTDFDAEVYNFKNGATTFARMASTGFNLPYLTPSQLIGTDASDNLVSLSTATYPSLTELTHLKGVTSGIQPQINGKFNTPTGLTTNYVTKWNGTALVNSQIFDNGTNVGIGTINPTTKLDINGGAKMLNYDVINGGFGAFYNGDNTNYSGIRNSGLTGVGNDNLDFFIGGSTRARFNAAGSLGVGTINPGARLDVVGNIRMTSANPMRFEFNKVGEFYNWIESDGVVGNNFMRFGVANTEYLRILQNGNVGIGTINPQQRLHTNISTAGVGVGLMLSNDATNATIGRGTGILFAGTGNANLAQIEAQTITASNNSGGLIFRTANGGALNERMRITNNGNVGIGTITPSASAILDINATTQGVLLPRMTTTQINAIASPTNGLLVYNTTLNKLCVYENTTWKQVTTTNM